jgi:hypothetical protein
MSMRKIGRADSAGRIVPRVTEVQDAEQLHCVFEEILIHALGGRHAPCGFAAGDRPAKPQTQGKIERWHQILKNRILLYNYYLPGNLERQISAFVEHYNHVSYHESLSNLTPADVYFGRAHTSLAERERIKRSTIATRRLQHQLQAD